MNRYALRNRVKQRQEIRKILNSATKTNENDTYNSVLNDEAPTKIGLVGDCLKQLEKYNFGVDQLKIYNDIIDFANFLNNLEEYTKFPIFALIELCENPWSLISIIERDDKKQTKYLLLYRSPEGFEITSTMKKFLKNYPEITVLTNVFERPEKLKPDYLKIIVVENLCILLRFIKNTSNILEFPKTKFITKAEVKQKIINKKIEAIMEVINKLKEKKKFLTKFKEFINNLPLDLSLSINEYHTVLNKELEKDENNINVLKLKKVKSKYLNIKDLKKVGEDYKINDEKLDLQIEFESEMEDINTVFKFLKNLKIDETFWKILKYISESFGISYEKIKMFYEYNSSAENETEESVPVIDNIENIIKNIPLMKNSVCSGCTPLKDLLETTIIGMDSIENTKSQDSDDHMNLSVHYKIVKDIYDKRYKDTDLKTINEWAFRIKGHLGTDDNSVCDAIAMMERAFNIINGGWRFRDPILLALLLYLNSKNKGRLCQVSTGEGKTNLVSLLATIKCLQGHQVDVITSSPLLADDGVNETKTFFSVFNITVSTNNPNTNTTRKIGYKADVVYGTIGNFQFDFLRDNIEISNLRYSRQFDVLILDEVDSMLIDNGGHIAKIATPFPGMDCLRHCYIKIWQKLQDAENSFNEYKKKIYDFLNNAEGTCTESDFQKFLDELKYDERRIIKDKIRTKLNLNDLPFIHAHLKNYVNDKLELWLKNALHAKYNCHEHIQYRVILNDKGEKCIAPVDYQNTGVTMKNTIWSNGLHQFLQLKHNLYLSFETLTSNYISNLGYIKKYNNENIFGMTGTLGSVAEQKLLASIYNVDFAKLPTFRKKKFFELSGIVAENDIWAKEIIQELVEMTSVGRAVLVIFSSEKDLLTVKKDLENSKIENFTYNFRQFSNESEAFQTKGKVNIGDVIFATNIAGRGTNFKTTKYLEENGGLHVCIAYLPCNLRVEEQAFGRTSRQGNNGTGRLIIKKEEVLSLEIFDDKFSFYSIKEKRDSLEQKRLETIQNILVKELLFKDEIYDLFSVFYKNLKLVSVSIKSKYALQDLIEFWAFYLEENNYTINKIMNTSAQKELEKFKEKAKKIIEDSQIIHNPFYSITLANDYLENDELENARKELQNALNISGSSNDLLVGAHMKMFEIDIRSQHFTFYRILQAIKDVVTFSVLERISTQKETTLNYLYKAKNGITKEIEYIQNNYSNSNSEFSAIIHHQQSTFLKHIYSRQFCLNIYLDNIQELIAKLTPDTKNLDLKAKVPTSIEYLKETTGDNNIEHYITDIELSELHNSGLDSIYNLREIYDVPKTILRTAHVMIHAGFASLIIGIAFLPVFPIMSRVASTLISEGLTDIIMAIIEDPTKEPDSYEYLKGKIITGAVNVLTFGLSALAAAFKLVQRTLNMCRMLSKVFTKSPKMKKLCTKLAKLTDEIGDYFEKKVQVGRFNKLSEADQLTELKELKKAENLKLFEQLGGIKKLENLTHNLEMNPITLQNALFKNAVKDIAIATASSLGDSLIEKQVLPFIINEKFDVLKIIIINNFKSSAKKNKNLMEKIRTSSLKRINLVFHDFTNNDKILDFMKDFTVSLFQHYNKNLGIFLKATDTTIQINIFLAKFEMFFEKNLEIGNSNNDTESVLNTISDYLSTLIFKYWVEAFHVAKTNIKISEKVKDKIKEKFKETSKLINENSKKFYETVLIGAEKMLNSEVLQLTTMENVMM